MRQKSVPAKEPATQVVKNIRRATRRHFSAEDKIRIVLEGLRGEDSIAELCRREGIVQNLYYRWSKDFLEAGKKRLAGDTARAATSDEVKDLRREAGALKEVVAELTLENRLLKKTAARHRATPARNGRATPARNGRATGRLHGVGVRWNVHALSGSVNTRTAHGKRISGSARSSRCSLRFRSRLWSARDVTPATPPMTPVTAPMSASQSLKSHSIRRSTALCRKLS